jgi:hypothetical protein
MSLYCSNNNKKVAKFSVFWTILYWFYQVDTYLHSLIWGLGLSVGMNKILKRFVKND